MRLNTEEKQMIIERLNEYNNLQPQLLKEEVKKSLNAAKELQNVKQFIAHIKGLIPEAQDKDFRYEEYWVTRTICVEYNTSRSNKTNPNIIYLDIKYDTHIPYPKTNPIKYINTSKENLSKYYVIFSTWDVNRKNKLKKLDELIKLIITEETKEK